MVVSDDNDELTQEDGRGNKKENLVWKRDDNFVRSNSLLNFTFNWTDLQENVKWRSRKTTQVITE